MKREENQRRDSLFSLCGLNCGLCPMHVRGDCGGCFTGSPCYAGCPFVPCSRRHGNVEYCFLCGEYPCSRYEGIDLHDSLISHRNQKKDLEKAREMGIGAYLDEQRRKKAVMEKLLNAYDDGRREVFFCLAANLLPAGDLEETLAGLERASAGQDRKEKADSAEKMLRACAEEKGIVLKLRR